MKTCPFAPCRDCDGALKPKGEARIQLLGGYKPAMRYKRAGEVDCPKCVEVTLPTGEPFVPEALKC